MTPPAPVTVHLPALPHPNERTATSTTTLARAARARRDLPACLPMIAWMRFKIDAQVGGCYYPRGAVLECLDDGDSVLLTPSLERYACIANVPRRLVERVNRFIVTALSSAIGEVCELAVFATDECQARAQVARRVEGLEILRVTRCSE